MQQEGAATRMQHNREALSYREIAEELKKNAELHEWGVPDLELWLRDKCKCVYCSKELISSYETSRLEYEYDHLLPHVEYPELDVKWDANGWKTDCDWKIRNIVLSCRTCNRIKHEHNANVWNFEGHKQAFVYQTGQVLTAEACLELRRRVTEYIQKKRKSKGESFARERELILTALG